MFVVFLFSEQKNVFSLNFHHLLTSFLLILQICVFASVCFIECVFLQFLILPNATSFVCCQSHFGYYSTEGS